MKERLLARQSASTLLVSRNGRPHVAREILLGLDQSCDWPLVARTVSHRRRNCRATTRQGPLATVLRESLLIGGWVAMWRPMDFFLYEWWAMRAELRMLDQLSDIAVRIVYTAESRPRTSDEPVTISSGREATLQPLNEI